MLMKKMHRADKHQTKLGNFAKEFIPFYNYYHKLDTRTENHNRSTKNEIRLDQMGKQVEALTHQMDMLKHR